MEEEKKIKEGINEDYPEWVSLDKTKNIIKQMEHSVCKIIIPNITKGTGFFTRIHLEKANEYIPVLITNNHVINELILSNEESKIICDIGDKPYYISLKDKKNYTKKEYDVTILEINEIRILLENAQI